MINTNTNGKNGNSNFSETESKHTVFNNTIGVNYIYKF
jgi:hypothetical protein